MKKILAICLVSALALGGLSACRTKEAPKKTKNYDGIELTYYKVFDDSDVIEPLINEYLATHPGLKINYRKFSDFEEYQNVLLNEMAEGEGPDVFSMPNFWFVPNKRKVQPMPVEMAKPKDFEETFVDVASKDLVSTDDSGVEQIYALPMTVDTLALYYNKDHFEDRLPEQGKPSNTWEGIKEDVQALVKEDNSFDRFEVAGIAMGKADNISRAVDILYLLFLQYGVDFYNEDVSEAIFAARQSSFLDYPATEALDFYTSFADSDNKFYSWNSEIAASSFDDQEIRAFAAEEVSMVLGFSYMYDDILNYKELLKRDGQSTIDKSAIRIAQVPQLFDPSLSTEKRSTYASYFAESVSRNTEHPELAWDFLIHMTSQDSLQQYFEKTNKPTSRRDMIEEQKKHPVYGIFASQIGYAESFPIVDYYVYRDLFAELIDTVDSSASERSSLVDVQDRITNMLPSDGYVEPVSVND